MTRLYFYEFFEVIGPRVKLRINFSIASIILTFSTKVKPGNEIWKLFIGLKANDFKNDGVDIYKLS